MSPKDKNCKLIEENIWQSLTSVPLPSPIVICPLTDALLIFAFVKSRFRLGLTMMLSVKPILSVLCKI